ncbi:ATP-NAD kinase [Dunaliella salina]|uniref:ATP-NAD kinase n=1 Tax=Dunaliella salina TaxID=3046 RepID=A0ABQ7G2B1_DUNSA|nr:ATP-NAD kinase [Dunaliella salina]|eukprot:KAF5828732.1 ATP-NAD kinase [Dunaliella salina]
MHWAPGAPSRVLIVKKPGNPDASQKMREIAAWLHARGIHVVVERPVAHAEFPKLDAYDAKIHPIDFCITLGGDGTVLHLASLFEHDDPLPPVISFAMGSLGFLTPFDATEYARCLNRVISANNPESPLYVTLRTRRRCELRHGGERLAMHNVLNEVVVVRGACASVADGLIISTPSGSTAYSMSAGGPMVTPSVPCSILTPIAPLSLSFRPLVIPESSDILIHLPEYARSNARISFDGKKALRMRKVTPSLCPLPLINMSNLDTDWYEGITGKLKWNQTLREPPKLPSTARSTRSGDETDDEGKSFVSQDLQRESDEYNSQLERLSKM